MVDHSDQYSAGNVQRDMGRLEGKVDALLTAAQNTMAAQIRADAERDNLARDIQENERRRTEGINSLRAEFNKNYSDLEKLFNDLKTKFYYVGGFAAAGGLATGAGVQKLIASLLGH